MIEFDSSRDAAWSLEDSFDVKGIERRPSSCRTG